MTITNQPHVMRKAEVAQLFQVSKTTLWNKIQAGLFPPPFSLGANSVGWLNTEINHILSLMVAGRTEEEIKQAVNEIVEQRQLVA